ncbi:hypothetical protein GW916_14710 [bacterium]|nr:hypothetical protein [bacterium]
MRILRNFLTPCCLLTLLFSCSSGTEQKAPAKNAKAPSEWNYDAIRKARAIQESEEASLPPQQEDDETMDCMILSATQMKNSGVLGCKALDPRAGYGENKFCCERE